MQKHIKHIPPKLFLLSIIFLWMTPICMIAQTTYHVKPSGNDANNGTTWTTAFATLQKAIEAASNGDEIWVAEGTYFPSKDKNGNTNANPRHHTFYFDFNIQLYGGFPNTGNPTMTDRNWKTYPSLLSGDLDLNDVSGLTGTDLENHTSRQDNVYTVVHTKNLSSTFLIDGFFIQNGNANANGNTSSSTYPNRSGGGMYNEESHPSVTNSSFSSNSANSLGGGVFNGVNSNPTITNSGFSNNSANSGGGMFNDVNNSIIINSSFSNNSANSGGGGMYNTGGTPTITNCSFTNNLAVQDGGGMWNNHSHPTITNSSFSNNSAKAGGGMSNWSDSNIVITNCSFTNNSAADLGGGIHNQSGNNPTIMNSSFSNNSARYGGGVSNYIFCNVTIINSSFSNNSASDEGAGIFNSASSLIIINCILWNNGSEIANDGSPSPATVTYSIVQGGYTGTNNLDQDPMFLDPANNDLRLQPSSPAIDIGSNTANSTTEDLAGNTRIQDFDGDGTVNIDMGAYEMRPNTGVPTLSEWGLLNLALLLMICGTLYLIQIPELNFKDFKANTCDLSVKDAT